MRLRKQYVIFLGLITVLIAGIQPALASASAYSANVSFRATDGISYDPVDIAFDVNVTLDFETTCNYAFSGDLASTLVCNLGIAPRSAALTVDYLINIAAAPSLSGRKSVPLSSEGKELLGDSAPIEVPIDGPGKIGVVIHGRLFGNVGIDSKHYISLEWRTWGTKSVNMTASAPMVPLLITKYRIFFTVTVSVDGSDPITRDTLLKEISGNPAELAIPEFPSIQVLSLFMITALSAVAIFKRKNPR